MTATPCPAQGQCPDPEILGAFASGMLSEAEWRGVLRHLSECTPCRRHVALLSLSEGAPLPEARLPAPLPRLPRRRSWVSFLQGVAAAAVLGAVAWALLAPPSPPRPTVYAPPPQPQEPKGRRENPKPPPVPLKTPMPAPDPLPPVVPTSDPHPPPPPPDRPSETPPTTVPEPRLAERLARGTAEAIEISPAGGALEVVTSGTIRKLAPRTYVNPNDLLRASEAGSFVLTDGATIYLPAESEVKISWSQTLLCYSIDVWKGEARVDLGAAPRMFHVAGGPLGVRFQEVSGPILVARRPDTLRATPLGGAASFRAPTGEGRILQAMETLVLGREEDAIEPPAAIDVPTPGPAPEAPAANSSPPAPAKPPPAAVPDARGILKSLADSTYRFRVGGRLLREGAWHPAGIVVSTVDEFAAARRALDAQAVHVRRGNRPWDDLGRVEPGSREDRLTQALRGAQAPHLLLEAVVQAAKGPPEMDSRQVGDRPCHVLEFTLDPARIRDEAASLLEQAVAERRMARPDHVYWGTLEGTLELSAARDDARLVRAVDRRRFSYSYKNAGGLDRRWYTLETAYEFFEHGKAAVRVPPDLAREIEAKSK